MPEPVTEPSPAIAVAGLASEAVAPSEPDTPAVDIARLRSSIDNYVTSYRRDGLEQYVLDCKHYRERHAGWDCPEGEELKTATQARIDAGMEETFRAWVYGRDLNIARSEKLMTEMLTLRPLMDQDGVLGEVARDAHFARVVEYERLNPGGGSFELLSIGGNGITLLKGVLSIGWNGKVRVWEFPRVPAPRPDDENEE
jgi:hypothetical protein